MASINAYQRPGSALEGIAHALDIVKSVYGIKGADEAAQKVRLENQAMQAQQAQTAQMADPNSGASKEAQDERALELQAAKQYKFLNDDQYLSRLKTLYGSPATPDVTANQVGPLNEDQAALPDITTPGSPATPGLSALALKGSGDSGAMGLVKGKQAADAAAARVQPLADAKRGQLGETQNQNSTKAGQAFENAPIIKTAKNNLNSLDRSLGILDNPDKPVSAKDFNLAYTDYINAVAAGGAATEGKIHRELPDNFSVDLNNLLSRVGVNQDLRQDASGSALISLLKQNISKVRGDLVGAMGAQARDIHDSYAQSDNPKVKEVIKQKLQRYNPAAFAEIYGGGDATDAGEQASGSAPAPMASGLPSKADIAAELQKRLKSRP